MLRKITDCKSLKLSENFNNGVLTVVNLQLCYKENSPQIVLGICTEN